MVNQGIYFTQIDRNWSNLIIGMMLLVAVALNDSFRKPALSAVPRKIPRSQAAPAPQHGLRKETGAR